MLQATFGDAFQVEDGKVVAYDAGRQADRLAKPGEPADFDEAIER
jgi:hypothetical protein